MHHGRYSRFIISLGGSYWNTRECSVRDDGACDLRIVTFDVGWFVSNCVLEHGNFPCFSATPRHRLDTVVVQEQFSHRIYIVSTIWTHPLAGRSLITYQPSEDNFKCPLHLPAPIQIPAMSFPSILLSWRRQHFNMMITKAAAPHIPPSIIIACTAFTLPSSAS